MIFIMPTNNFFVWHKIMIKKFALSAFIAASLPGIALAHTPLFSCYDFGDDTVLCEGGFSDGSSAKGTEILIIDGSGKELIKSKLNADSEIEFDKPSGEYKVLFNGGPGHSIEINGKDIVG